MPPIDYIAVFRAYLDCFKHKSNVPRNKNQVIIQDEYTYAVEDAIWDRLAPLDGDPEFIDSGLEAVLAFYDSAAIQAIRPVQAEQILPHNRASEIKLAGAIFQNLQAIKFLDPQDRNRIGHYETELKFRTDKNKITQAELNAALRASISTAVDEEFNKISLGTYNYNAVLARDPKTGQYTLYYERPEIQNDDEKLTAPTLDALLVAMRNGQRKADFTTEDLTIVRAQAALIPAVSRSKDLDVIKQALVNFYVSPSDATWQGITKIYYGYKPNTRQEVIARETLRQMLYALNTGLGNKLVGR
jgi:hypothetical protein